MKKGRLIFFLLFTIMLIVGSAGMIASIFEYKKGVKEYLKLQKLIFTQADTPSEEDSVWPLVSSPEDDPILDNGLPWRQDDSGSVLDEGSREDSDNDLADLNLLLEINPDAAGWIMVDGTAVNYPVVRGSNNVYYLSHSFEKNKLKNGCIFLDSRSSIDFSDYNSIIYGHNMRDGSMFHDLDLITGDSSPLVSHIIQIYTPSEALAFRPVFSGVVEDDDDIYTLLSPDLDAARFHSYLTGKIPDYIFKPEGETYLTLSTCADNGRKRMVVIARSIP